MSLLVKDLFLNISHELYKLGSEFFITSQIFLEIVNIDFLVVLRVSLTCIIHINIDNLCLFDEALYKLLSKSQFTLFPDELFFVHSFLLSPFEPLILLVISMQLLILSNRLLELVDH